MFVDVEETILECLPKNTLTLVIKYPNVAFFGVLDKKIWKLDQSNSSNKP